MGHRLICVSGSNACRAFVLDRYMRGTTCCIVLWGCDASMRRWASLHELDRSSLFLHQEEARRTDRAVSLPEVTRTVNDSHCL